MEVVAIRGEHYAARSNFQLNGVPKMLGRNGTVSPVVLFLFSLFLPPLFLFFSIVVTQSTRRRCPLTVMVAANYRQKSGELTLYGSVIAYRLDKRAK